MIIAPDTYIPDLVEAGIVPGWMWRDIEPHGMYEAENILNEYDWDLLQLGRSQWGWDIGDGYNEYQLKELARVRAIISEGIKAYEANPKLKQEAKEKRELAKRKEALIKEYINKLRNNFDLDEIGKVVDYILTNGEPPYFTLLYGYLHSNTRTDRQKIRILMAGVMDGKQHTPKETFEMLQTGNLPDGITITEPFPVRTLQRWSKKSFTPVGQLAEYLEAISSKVAEEQARSNYAPMELVKMMLDKEDSNLICTDSALSSIVNTLKYFNRL